eukprot:Hpha_TRINITY_DN15528_c1_g3::TRINITY_DN15528_c1_g3_i1::g.104797::m.104797/K06639/CDC14; cell division cycle 14
MQGGGGLSGRQQRPGVPSVLIPERLFFVLVAELPPDSTSAHYFQIDDIFVYEPFFSDFGPLNAAHTKRFSDLVDAKLANPSLQGKDLYFCADYHDRERATNAATLAAIYMCLRRSIPPDTALHSLGNWAQCFTPFRDASPYPSAWQLQWTDVVRGVVKAYRQGWYPIQEFDPARYEFYEQLCNGDWNWLVPERFLAFSGPNGPHTMFCPEDYVVLFRDIGVNTIVRLNKPTYDRSLFLRNGFRHVDLFFSDGSTPPPEIVDEFLDLAERGGCVAVHCKAGLGRTGTLVGLWLMQNHGFTAAEAVGWIRFMRPGSIIGPQQNFLVDMEGEMLSRFARGSRASRGAPSFGHEAQPMTNGALHDHDHSDGFHHRGRGHANEVHSV